MGEQDEVLEIVNEDNVIIGRATRAEVYTKGLYHRAVSIVVLNSERMMLLQQRSSAKRIFPLFWDLSASEHLKPGESYEEGAKRGLEEELGIKGVPVRRIRESHISLNEYGGRKDYEFAELYLAVADEPISIDRQEVAQAGFYPLSHISQLEAKGLLTPWFQDEWNWMKNNPTVLRT